jgi:ketosteroid isomerase-like protein
MAQSNAELVNRAYQAFATGDIPAVLQLLASDVTWHIPGRSPLSAEYKGHDGVLDFFGRCQELSGGTIRVGADEILADGDRVVVLSTVSAERHGQFWSSPEVHVLRVADGRITAFREFQGDQETEDLFWAS